MENHDNNGGSRVFIFKPVKKVVNSFLFDMFTYSTVRSATIKSSSVGIVYRVAQLSILVYIVGYELMLKKGYQSFDQVQSVVTTKVKGQGYVPKNLNKTLNKKDPNYFEKLFTLDPNITYNILDPAGKILKLNIR